MQRRFASSRTVFPDDFPCLTERCGTLDPSPREFQVSERPPELAAPRRNDHPGSEPAPSAARSAATQLSILLTIVFFARRKDFVTRRYLAMRRPRQRPARFGSVCLGRSRTDDFPLLTNRMRRRPSESGRDVAVRESTPHHRSRSASCRPVRTGPSPDCGLAKMDDNLAGLRPSSGS